METTINADDFGMSISINSAISQCFKLGIIQRTTIMVNMPGYEDALAMSKRENFYDKVGLHLNLMEGIPLTYGITQFPEVCTDGYFNGMLQEYLRTHLIISKSLSKALRDEMEAQILVYVRDGFPLFHIDSHFHLHNEFLIFNILKPLAIRYGFRSMRILRNLMVVTTLKDFLKLLYKRFMNHRIKKDFLHTAFFGSYEDYLKCYEKSSVEIMVHPVYKNNILYDITNNKQVPISIYNKHD